MAYLKGNTYVDGSLYVDGALVVKRLSDTSGVDLPYLETSTAAQTNSLVKFATDDGGLTSSSISESIANKALVYTIKSNNSSLDKVSLLFNNTTLVISNTPAVEFNVTSGKLTTGYDELVGVIKEGSTITYGGRSYKITITTGDNYYVIDGVNYKEVPERDSSYPTDKPWFEPDLFWYSSLAVRK